MTLFSEVEQLEQGNAWYCNKCKEHVEATKHLNLYKLPQILILALKRFKAKMYWRDKNTAFVDFPLEGLDLGEFLGEKKEGEEWVYDCFAVSNHYGGLGGGHYTAFAKNSEMK